MLARNLSIEYRGTMNDEWMSAAEVHKLAARNISHFSGKEAICKRAHAGLVKARAKLLVWHKEQRNLNQIASGNPGAVQSSFDHLGTKGSASEKRFGSGCYKNTCRSDMLPKAPTLPIATITLATRLML